MLRTIVPELVNGVFGDPALYCDFAQEGRAVLFDLGDLGALPAKRILRLSDVFVSHAHMDHFSGFDRLLRTGLGCDMTVRLYGPPGFLDRVEHKLAGYTWNAVGRYPADFTFLAHEIAPDWEMAIARFRSHGLFGREPLPGRPATDGVLLDEPEFRVRAALLDHEIPCLGFAFEEKPRVNVLRERLAALELPDGAWLQDLKRAVAQGLPDETPVRAWWREAGGARHERVLPLGTLKAEVLQVTSGAKLCYVTDVVYHAENADRIARLAAGAELLFIETVFLAAEAEHATRKFHLTAEQAGRIARAAGAKAVVPFHFSPRYAGREAELHAELERARHGPD